MLPRELLATITDDLSIKILGNYKKTFFVPRRDQTLLNIKQLIEIG